LRSLGFNGERCANTLAGIRAQDTAADQINDSLIEKLTMIGAIRQKFLSPMTHGKRHYSGNAIGGTMGKETDYTKHQNPKWKAIKDIEEYFGKEKFRKVEKEMRKVKDYHQFRLACFIGGIEGYPVDCWYDLLHGELNRKKHEGI